LLKSRRLKEIGTWGKHLLLFFDGDLVLKIHFLMWGSYSIDKPKEKRRPRLALVFPTTKIYFYACSIKFLQENVDDVYDWSADTLSPSWNAEAAMKKIKSKPNEMVCDVLMNQQIFSGVGNIIKNEIQYILKVRPQRKIKDLSEKKKQLLVDEAQSYSWKFYYWKKNYELKKHWQIMRKKTCPNCNGPVTRKVTGKFERISFYCERCQK